MCKPIQDYLSIVREYTREIITFGGFVIAGLSFLVALIYLVMKLINWYGFNAGMAPIVIGVFLMGGLQLAALGFIGEYILTINQRVMNKPLVIEEERLNFPGGESGSHGAPQRRIS